MIDHYPSLRPPFAQINVAPLPCVLGHEPSLTQAISNLLTNAVKFVPEKVTPIVNVWAENEASVVRVWFEDNGIGIAPEHQARIFALFEGIHPEQNYPGTGIGLAVVRKALERNAGRVGVISDGVNGSKFWIELRTAPES